MFSLIATGLIAFNLFQVGPVTAIKSFGRAKTQLNEIRVKREAHLEQIGEIRDERLQERLVKFSERFGTLSDKWATHWASVLERLTGILDKIEAKSGELAADGKDISGVDVAIATARSAISDSQTAVDEFAANLYEFEVDDEATIGENVRAMITQFKEDAATVRTSVKDARTSVHSAFQELRKVFSGQVERGQADEE